MESGEQAPTTTEILPATRPGSEHPLAAIARTEIDQQISTAKKYPRSVAHFLKEAEAMACINEEAAAECFYVLTRKKADGSRVRIEGPSIRLAEIMASAWTNLRFGARPIGEDGRTVTVEGFCHDLQTNVARYTSTTRSILDRNKRRFSDEMVAMTTNAAGAIAARNAVIGVIPRAYVNHVLERAKKVAAGKAVSMEKRCQQALDYFEKTHGVSRGRVLAALDRKGVEELTSEDLDDLTGIKTAIKEGETTLEDAFPLLPDEKRAEAAEGKTPADRLAGELRSKAGGTKPEPGTDG